MPHPRPQAVPLSEEQVRTQLAAHPQWQLQHGRLERQFTFPSFKHAFSFMTRVALLAEEHNHHPTWQNTYAQVHISLYTHDTGGLTEKDTAMAQAIDALLP